MDMLSYLGQGQGAPRVYCYSEPHFWLEDGTPLYTEWLIEGRDSILYVVPAELGGWLRRRKFEGLRSSLKPVLLRKARIIVRLLCQGVVNEEEMPTTQFMRRLSANHKPSSAEVSPRRTRLLI